MAIAVAVTIAITVATAGPVAFFVAVSVVAVVDGGGGDIKIYGAAMSMVLLLCSLWLVE